MKIIESSYMQTSAIVDNIHVEINVVGRDIDYYDEFITQLLALIENVKIHTGRLPMIGEKYNLAVWKGEDPVELVVDEIVYYSSVYCDENYFSLVIILEIK